MRRALLATIFLAACNSPGTPVPLESNAATSVFDLTADLTQQASFYDVPYPSDLRLTAQGTPDLTGLPWPAAYSVFDGIRKVAMLHPGFPVVPVAYFKFSAPVAAQDVNHVLQGVADAPILLVDVDPASKDRGTLIPVVATNPPSDAYVLDPLLAVAPRPGFVLHPGRKYAFVVMSALGDAQGNPLRASSDFDLFRRGVAVSSQAKAAQALYAPLWDTLATLKIDASQVVIATVFTTGDVVAELSDLSTKLLGTYTVTLDGLHVDPADPYGGGKEQRFCELKATVTYPQFQTGKPPFDTGGLFVYGADGVPRKQRDEVAPAVITLPKGPMPAAGFPLVVYFHGSGGLSTAVVDRGTWVPTKDASKCPEKTLDVWNGVSGCNTKGEGPAYVLAPFGFAAAGTALPVNPERLPGATETAYLNVNNLAAGHDTFRQGVIEQRLFIEALSKLEIPAAMLAPCTGTTLPAGAKAFHFDVKDHLHAMGQSMGGQYTNLVSATEPLIKASVPTGAGGFWSHYVLITTQIPNAAGAVGTLLLGTEATLTFLHPALSVFETAWEGVDPMVYMPRLGRRPLPGHPVRPIYEPVGQGDSYFPEETYDAMALAYGHKEAGSIIWPTMQAALTLEGRDGLVPYPVKGEVPSEAGGNYTGVVVQYKGDGIYDPHAIYSQLDAVKYQYGCFLSTFLATGTATVPAPAPFGTPCAH